MVVLGMKPSRKAPCVRLNPSCLMIGPFRMISVSAPGVLPLCSTPYSGSHIASMRATSTGMYSGRQPTMTPLAATLQTVAAR
jgi:hypothetical protein